MPNKLRSTGLFWLWIAILVIGVDRFAKYWIVHHLTTYETFAVLPIFNLILVYNKGASFGFLNTASGWQNLFFGSLALIVSIMMISWLAKLSARDNCLAISLSLIVGGALGNAWDRILYGHVVDFFDFHIGNWHFAVFNVADSAICIGAFMLLIHWLRQSK